MEISSALTIYEFPMSICHIAPHVYLMSQLFIHMFVNSVMNPVGGPLITVMICEATLLTASDWFVWQVDDEL